VNAAFEFPLTPQGARLSLSYEQNYSEIIEDMLSITDIESEFQAAEISLEHPLINQLNRKFSIGLALALRESRTWLVVKPQPLAPGVQDDGFARTSVLRFSQEFSDRTPNQVLAARSTFNLGLDQFDATINRNQPDGRYFSWVGQLRYARKTALPGAQWIVSAGVQLSSDQLLPQEQFAVGGANSVRGYRENHYVRDNGWNLSLEYRHPLFGTTADSEWGVLQLAPFADVGNGWDRHHYSADDTISSIGLGLIWNYRSIRATLYAAKALKHIDLESTRNLQDDGLHFQIEARIF